MGSRENTNWLPGLDYPPHGSRLTAHVSHVAVLPSPVTSSARLSETNPFLTSTAEAEANTDTPDQGDGEDGGDDEYPLCYDCGRYFWSHEEASYHAKVGHNQDTEMVPSSALDGSPISVSASPVLAPTSRAANPSVHPSYSSWKIGPGTASFAGDEDITPNSPDWTTE